jgi:hypothetical protein
MQKNYRGRRRRNLLLCGDPGELNASYLAIGSEFTRTWHHEKKTRFGMQKNVYLKISEACYTGNVSKPKKKHRSDQ